MNIVAIIQARMGSSRLPNKVMMRILDKPMIEWIVTRVGKSKYINDIVLATTNNGEDDCLVEWCQIHGIKFYRGSENDVLSRYYFSALNNKADIVVRITADDPLKDASIIDYAVEVLIASGAAYCSNTISPTYPEGLDVEVFTFAALSEAFEMADLNSEREHVTPYIWKNKNKFDCVEISFLKDLSAWRWTVDKIDDIEFIRDLIMGASADINTSYVDLIQYIESSPSILNRCRGRTIRNEGYIKSLKME